MDALVETIMSKKLVAISTGATVDQALQLMKEKRFRHLPVVDELNNIVGIVSQRDLNFADEDTFVEDVMNAPVEFVDQGLSIKSAISKMLQMKISCILVVDDDKNAVGIVTTDDLLWYLAHLLLSEAPEVQANDPAFKFESLQTIGEIANELAMAGI